MSLIDWYPQIKQAHVALVAMSGTLFALRGIGVLQQARWPMRSFVRAASVAIDTLLLAAGATLWWLLRLDPTLSDRWLGAKLALLLAYIALGSVAMHRARRTPVKALFLLAALIVFATMLSIALTRNPLGAWRLS